MFFIYSKNENGTIDIIITADLLFLEIENISQFLKDNNNFNQIELWLEVFNKYKFWTNKIELFKNDISKTMISGIRDNSVYILTTLLEKSNITNYFPITERTQVITDIYNSITSISQQLNFVQVNSNFGSKLVQFQTSTFGLNDEINFTFGYQLNIKIPQLNLTETKIENVSATAVLLQDLSGNFSFNYPINSQIFAIIAENESVKNRKIEFTYVII